jgi:hypothetical protein
MEEQKLQERMKKGKERKIYLSITKEKMVRKSRDIYMTVEALHPEMRTKK